MDNFGYKNWGNDSSSYNDSDQSSPEKYFHHNKKGKQEEESYNFDASYDFINSPVINNKKTRRNSTSDVFLSDSSNRYNSSSNLRRVSIDDRAKEILERNKSLKLSDSFGEDNTRLKSYEDTLAELREGGYLQSTDYSNDVLEYNEPPIMKASPTFQISKLDSPLDSPFGGTDSLEISAADLEVGTYSKRIQERKSKERTADRGRRMSFDHKSIAGGELSYQSIPLNAKVASSPDISKTRRSNAGIEIKSDALDNRLQFSTALSSIHKSHTVGERLDKESKYNNSVAHYGSMERSDDEIYKMLNVTTETQESMKFGNQDSILDNSIPINTKKRPSIGDLSDVTQRSASPQMNYNDRIDPSASMNDQTYDSDENQDEDTIDGSGDSNFPLDDNKKKDLAISTNNNDDGDDDEDEYSLDEFEDPSPLKQNTIPLDPVDEIRQRWYNAESSDFLQKLSTTDSYSYLGKNDKELEQSLSLSHHNVSHLLGSKLNKSPETIINHHDEYQPKADENDEYTNETNIQSNLYGNAADPSLLDSSHHIATMNSNMVDASYVDNSSLIAPKHNLFISTVGSASLVTSIPPAALPTMTESRDIQSKISTTSPILQVNILPRPSLGDVFPIVLSEDIGHESSQVKRSSFVHSELEDVVQGETENKEDKDCTGDASNSYDDETKNENNTYNRYIVDNNENQFRTNEYVDTMNNKSEYLSIDNLPRYFEEKRVNEPSSSIVIPNTQPMKVPNLYRRSSTGGINLSTGGMITHLSAASRYQTTTEDEIEETLLSHHQQPPLNPNLRHSIVASIIEATNEDPPKLYYEPSDSENHRVVIKSSKENDIKYIATKLPSTQAAIPWYPSDVNPEKTFIKEKTIHTRLAAATALKIKQHFSLTPSEREKQRKTRPRYGISKSIATPTISKSFKENPSIHSNNNELHELERISTEAVNRLTQENWRLFRKYERLEQGLQELKHSSDHKETSNNNNNNNKTNTNNNININTSKNNSDSNNYSNKLKDLRIESNNSNKIKEMITTSQDDIDIVDRKEPWEIKIESALSHLQEENEKLLAREKGIVVREEALLIREKALENKEKLLISSTFYKKNKDQSKNDIFLEEELSILREKEHELLLEIDRLKAMIFNNEQAKNILDDNSIKEKQGFNPDLDLSKSYQLLLKKYIANKHKSGSLLSKTTTTSTTTANDNNNTNNDKELLQQLLNENATQERLLEGFQKENERLLVLLKQQEVEYNMRMSIFYDQREEMNKELNKLRNKHHVDQHMDSHRSISRIPSNHHNYHSNNELDCQSYEDRMIPTSRKTADTLRMELNMDATIRTLKDKVAEAESQMCERERELQVTIEKLNRENRDLITTISSLKLSQAPYIPQDQDYIQLQTENKNHLLELQNLKQKLKWYVENQNLIDQIDMELVQSKTANHAMRKELLKRGMENKAIERLIANEPSLPSSKLKKIPVSYKDTKDQDDYSFHQIEQNASPHMDRSSISSVVTRNRTQHRNFADVKKIKELEGVIRDLQDSLTKRHPDSVANLIRAATVSDSIQLKHRKQDEYIESLQEEVKHHKEIYERKLRSLRQEHEKVKQQYIETISNLQQQLQLQPSSLSTTTNNITATSIHPLMKSKSDINDLSQANQRINELEIEMERIRSFYTKKVQDLQHKSETQIRALKRGLAPSTMATTASALAVVGETSSSNNNNNNNSGRENENLGYNLIQNQNDKIENISKFYSDRLLLLEKELMKTTEELGRLKATTSTNTTIHNDKIGNDTQTTILSNNNTDNIVNIDNNISKSGHTHIMDVISSNMNENNSNVLNNIIKEKELLELQRKEDLLMHSKERSILQQSFDNHLKDITSNHQHYIEQITNIWKLERDNLTKRLEEEELRCKDLRKELLSIINNTTNNSNNQQSPGYQESKSLELSQFQQMENQINTLEKRLMRRDQELMRRDQELSAAVEESKQAARIERSRLEALHSQELNEKDHQLVKFQQELIQLVSLLRQQKHIR